MENTAATPAPVPSTDIPSDAKTMAMLSHLLSIFFGFIPPLIIWLAKKQEHPFIEDQSKEALNFQITMAIVWVVFMIFAAVTLGLGGLLFPVIMLVNLILCIMAALKAKDGIQYRYPFAIRLVK